MLCAVLNDGGRLLPIMRLTNWLFAILSESGHSTFYWEIFYTVLWPKIFCIL